MRLIIVTAPIEKAAEIGRVVVEAGLAACVNIIPKVRSIYTWQGNIEDDEEAMMFFKTTEETVEKLTAAIRARHPYEVPEIVAIEIKDNEGNPDYLEWVKNAVS